MRALPSVARVIHMDYYTQSVVLAVLSFLGGLHDKFS